MQKLIKINTDHYVIVDDSQIKEGDWLYSFDNGLIVQANSGSANTINSKSLNGRGYSKITHSTRPFGGSATAINLHEVKELIGEVDMAFKHYPIIENNKQHNDRNYYRRAAYYRALEDNKEKKYTEEDLRKAIEMAQSQYWDIDNRGFSSNTEGDWSFKYTDEEIIQSLQPKTEWEVEWVDGKIKLI